MPLQNSGSVQLREDGCGDKRPLAAGAQPAPAWCHTLSKAHCTHRSYAVVPCGATKSLPGVGSGYFRRVPCNIARSFWMNVLCTQMNAVHV